ncbi:hypothetical protein R5R35_006927 [Gryllus longicercus]|uniref:Uncharacterized protein n=1 Tax=Gryllus longicercus TaxID=2509291 RepID=A0AAN9VCM2_9ORTH
MLRRQGNAPVLLWLLVTCVLAAVNGPRALLPTPEGELPGVRDNDEQVVFAMGQTPTSHTTCPSFKNSFQWQARGRDAVIARILAEHTGHLLLGCHIIPGNPHRISPAVFLLNATAHVYMEALYWDPALVYKVEYLYPHLQDDVGLAMRSPDSLTPTIYKAFSSSVWALTGISLLLFATMLKFVLQATCSQAALETTQIFLSGSFSSRRPRHMM